MLRYNLVCTVKLTIGFQGAMAIFLIFCRITLSSANQTCFNQLLTELAGNMLHSWGKQRLLNNCDENKYSKSKFLKIE